MPGTGRTWPTWRTASSSSRATSATSGAGQDLAEHEIDTIVHFAAESHNSLAILDPGRFFRTNVLGTQTMLRGGPPDGVTGSTTSRPARSTGTWPSTRDEAFTEDTPYRPRTPYNASKAGADHAVRAYGETFELPVTITNCCNNYGPYQFPEKVIPLFTAWPSTTSPCPCTPRPRTAGSGCTWRTTVGPSKWSSNRAGGRDLQRGQRGGGQHRGDRRRHPGRRGQAGVPEGDRPGPARPRPPVPPRLVQDPTRSWVGNPPWPSTRAWPRPCVVHRPPRAGGSLSATGPRLSRGPGRPSRRRDRQRGRERGYGSCSPEGRPARPGPPGRAVRARAHGAGRGAPGTTGSSERRGGLRRARDRHRHHGRGGPDVVLDRGPSGPTSSSTRGRTPRWMPVSPIPNRLRRQRPRDPPPGRGSRRFGAHLVLRLDRLRLRRHLRPALRGVGLDPTRSRSTGGASGRRTGGAVAGAPSCARPGCAVPTGPTWSRRCFAWRPTTGPCASWTISMARRPSPPIWRRLWSTLGARPPSWLFHVTNQGTTTWFEFVRAVLAAAGHDPARVEPIATTELDPPRPPCVRGISVLDNAALRLGGPAPPARLERTDWSAWSGPSDRPARDDWKG